MSSVASGARRGCCSKIDDPSLTCLSFPLVVEEVCLEE